MPDDIDADDELRRKLERFFPDLSFRRTVTVNVSGEDLYWLVNLAVEGIASRRKAWSDKQGRVKEIADLVNLAEFRTILARVVAAVEKPAEPKPKPRGKPSIN